jgi:HAMP domain-containing protein
MAAEGARANCAAMHVLLDIVISPGSFRISMMKTVTHRKKQQVQIRTQITSADLREALRLNRKKTYWLNVFLGNWYATLLLIAITWAEIARLVDRKPIRAASLGLLLIPIFFLWFSRNRAQSRLRTAAAQLSDTQSSVSIDEKGITAASPTGAIGFVPWRDYSGWKEGKDVFTLTTDKSFRVLPKRGLNEGDLEQLRSMFRTQIM